VTQRDEISGTAGASARREHERRRAAREARLRKRFGRRLGGVVLALQQEPADVSAWRRGGEGEELVAQALAKRCPGVIVLHDRRIPGTRANIDHIAVAANGVWVIDAKRYKGKVAVSRPLLGKAKLKVAGRDKTKLVVGLATQVELVTAAVGDIGADVAVNGCFCFVGSDLPLLGTPTINGFAILERRRLAKRLNARGSLGSADREALAAALAARFPIA
jgi:hypothetical protein